MTSFDGSPIVAEVYRRLLYVVESESLCRARISYPLWFKVGSCSVRVKRAQRSEPMQVLVRYHNPYEDEIDLILERTQALILPGISCVQIHCPYVGGSGRITESWGIAFELSAEELAGGTAGLAISLIEEGEW